MRMRNGQISGEDIRGRRTPLGVTETAWPLAHQPEPSVVTVSRCVHVCLSAALLGGRRMLFRAKDHQRLDGWLL